MSKSIAHRLRETAAERLTASADHKNQYLSVVAKISRADGALMIEAADEIDRLQSLFTKPM